MSTTTMTRGRALAGLLAIALLAACQGPRPTGQGLFQLEANAPTGRFHERLDVTAALGRHVLATVADVARLDVAVVGADNGERHRVLLPADLSAGRGLASFDDLPPGPAGIDVRAYDAGDRQIARAQQLTTLLQGQANRADVTFYLETAAPSPGPGQTAVAIELHDGPTVQGPPPAAVPLLPALWSQIAYVGTEDSPFLLDRSGAAWVGGSRVLQDGSVLSIGEPLKAAALTAQGQIWALRGDKLQLMNTQVQVLKEQTVAWTAPPNGMAVDAADNLWVATGSQLRKFKSDGTASGVFDLPGEAGKVVVDKASGVVWVTMTTRGQVARFSSSGALLGVTTVNPVGDWLSDIALDSKGNAWIAERFTNRLAKLRPDGSLYGRYAGPLEPMRLLVDAQDNVLVASYNALYIDESRKYSPDGRLIARYTLRYVWGWAFDASGALLLVISQNDYSGTLCKVNL